MNSLWSMLQDPVFVLCLFAGAYVVLKFCFDQFDKPSLNPDENDPWKFVPPRNLTPPQQYLFGFFVYSGFLMLLFLGACLIGPKRFSEITQGLGVSNPELDGVLKSSSTFPVVVAFFIVGLYPNLPIPKWLDVEIVIRRLAHRIAYIPKNMDLIFNYMRFSEVDLTQEKIDEAWNAIGLPRPALDAPDCGSIRTLLDRAVLLYVRARNFATEGEVGDIQEVMKDLSMEVFRQYRDQIENVEMSVQAVCLRLSELNRSNGPERKKSIQAAHRELIKSVEFLYVIFACAITSKGMDRVSKRLYGLGFRSTFAPETSIPWDPILKSLAASAIILATGLFIAVSTLHDVARNAGIPTESSQILWLLILVMIVHLVATAEALRVRARLINRDEYFLAEMGSPQAIAIVKLAASCFGISLGFYLFLNLGQLISSLADSAAPALDPTIEKQSSAELIWDYFKTYTVWSLVPACSAVMTAWAIGRSDETRLDRLIWGSAQGGMMAVVALVAVSLVTRAPFGVYVFTLVLYGGLGLILGYMLPFAIRRHWAALETRLPDKIAVLRTSVLQYFHDIQQFTEWLNRKNEMLKGRRPLDVLSEEAGLQKLTALVAETRTKVFPAVT